MNTDRIEKLFGKADLGTVLTVARIRYLYDTEAQIKRRLRLWFSV